LLLLSVAGLVLLAGGCGEVSTAHAVEEKEDADKIAALLDPRHERFQHEAPPMFDVKFDTSRGTFIVRVEREWAPRGADRFYNLALNGYYDEVRFFRVIEGFMAQFGIHGEPRVAAAWRGERIVDDPVRTSNARGTLSFATAGPNTRTTQLFINYSDNAFLDDMGFAPIGKVIEGMDVVDALYSGYGEGAPRGRGPDQGEIQRRGNAYLAERFERLDHIKSASIVQDETEEP